MQLTTRRELLSEIGKGMLTASVGTALASEMGISPAFAETESKALEFGRLEPLVQLMQENSAEKMLPLVINKISQGTSLRDVVASAALANARTFGGEDYIGFHAFMAMMPAYQMTSEMPADRRALPLLKVLYRSTNQIQAKGGRSAEVLHTIDAMPVPTPLERREGLRAAERRGDVNEAEGIFAGLVGQSAIDAYNDLQVMIQDDVDVHRTVLAYRAWDLLGLTGKEHAHTTLRQSVRYCVAQENNRKRTNYPESGIRTALPKIIDQYHVATLKFGSREADDMWLNSMCNTLLNSAPAQAAEAVAQAITEGFSPNAIGEALSLSATRRVLTDPGRTAAYPGKPIGSVHGDSVGVHASDSMNAWRNMAKVSNHYNALTGLIVGGYHLAASTGNDWKQRQPYSVFEHTDAITEKGSSALLASLDGAIREKNQARAAAIVKQYGSEGHGVRPVFDMLLTFATSEDGALHAEKYYRTVSEEFGRTRKSMRWEHVTALARVTASEYGKRAEGYELACDLLKVKA
ncbi:MAG: hypothetical protein ABJA67_15640 [Chthonomonadales bacterium]